MAVISEGTVVAMPSVVACVVLAGAGVGSGTVVTKRGVVVWRGRGRGRVVGAGDGAVVCTGSGSVGWGGAGPGTVGATGGRCGLHTGASHVELCVKAVQ